MNVLQLIDSLEAGGAERMAVNIANELQQQGVTSHLCVTRKEGGLQRSISKKVGYLFLNRKETLDFKALFRLRNYIKKHDIRIIHAHSTSFFLAVLVKMTLPKTRIVWHDHYGKSEQLDERKAKILKLTSRWFSVVLSVNKLLADWATSNLHCSKVFQLENFPDIVQYDSDITALKGKEGKRIVCLANLRPQKDHFNLLKAFKSSFEKHPDWTLHIVGMDFKDGYSLAVNDFVKEQELEEAVFFYGSVPDVANVLLRCEIGVLSSNSEGLPVSLLEYGLAGLAAISTKVGECDKVLKDPSYGLLVPPKDYKKLTEALNHYIENPETRQQIASQFQGHIKDNYSKVAVVQRLYSIYESI